jgi:GNAT superfamily N-acetyltransferase
MTIAPEILAIAETLNLCLPPPPDEERVVGPRFAAFVNPKDDPHRNLVQRIRVGAGEVEALVAEVRALFRARGRTGITWETGPSTEPVDLYERLLALGMVPDDEPEVAGMVLARPPAATAPGVTVRRAETLADFGAHATILRRCFAPGEPDPTEAEIVADFERRRGREPHLVRYLALSDGAPIAAADGILVDGAVVLCGGATLPEARGKGAYRALIDARWSAAVARGTPVLVVQAGAMSKPILARLGFEEVARVRVLLDRFG